MFNSKLIRAALIKDYLRACGKPLDVVCFTCGNAARALRETGLEVLEIGGAGPLQPTTWWTPRQIARAWPTKFDATSGHLPLDLMLLLAAAFRNVLGDNPITVVPSGSGETAVAMALAYPTVKITARYNNANPATTYNSACTLNSLVEALCNVEHS